MSLSAIPGEVRRRIFQRDQGRCLYCRLSQVGQSAVFHINHINPKSKGGRTDDTNLALQCPYCSLHKSNKINAVDPIGGENVALFHPLQQLWSEHFALHANGVCEGISPPGRATIAALRMNDPLPRLARALQIQLGLIRPDSQ